MFENPREFIQLSFIAAITGAAIGTIIFFVGKLF